MKPVFNTQFAFDLRAQPFDEQSKFIVGTGGPLAGKSTVLEALGFPYKPETARAYLEHEMRSGKTIEELRGDEASFQRSLVEAKLAVELASPKDRPIAFDRALPDSITYYRLAGLDPTPVLRDCKRVRYAIVLHFDLLPDDIVAVELRRDPIRTEDVETRRLLDVFLERDYAALGYEVVRVPVLPVRERISLVRRILASYNLIPE